MSARKRHPTHAVARRARTALVLLAALYLASVWVDGVGTAYVTSVLPRPIAFFAQVAALFTHASSTVIEYRAEGWLCADHRWVELDTRPYFPIDADNKENRFERAMHFYRENRPTMLALDEYLMRRHNGAAAPIGGVRFLSLRIPFPEPGGRVERHERRPLDTYPEQVRHAWYRTPSSRRAERCGYADRSIDEPEPAPQEP